MTVPLIVPPPSQQGRYDHENETEFRSRLELWGRSIQVQNSTEWALKKYTPTVYNVQGFGAKGDGLTDDTTAITRAFTAAGAVGGTVYFPPGRYLTTGVTHTGSSVTVLGYGATLIQNANTAALTLMGGYSSTTALTAIATVNYDYSGGGNTTPVSRLSMAALPTVAVGDYVKVVSNDQLAGTRAAVGALVTRRGEYATVGAISGTDVYLHGVLRDTYTTSPRMSVLRNVSFDVEGLTFDTATAGDAAGWNAQLLVLKAAHTCRMVNLTCIQGYGTFINPIGLKGYLISGCRSNNLRNEPATNRFGYGVSDNHCEDGRIIGCEFGVCRHGVTTNVDQLAADSTQIEQYGACYGGRVIGCHSYGSSNSGFDTHLGAIDWSFIGCRSGADVRGPNSWGAGWQVRGKQIRFIDCVARGSRVGVQILDEGISGGTDDVLFQNCDIREIASTPVFYFNCSGSSPKVIVDGGYYAAVGKITDFDTTTDITFRNGVKLVSSGNVDAYAVELTNATMRVDGLILDMTGMTAASPVGFSFTDGSTLTGQRLDIVATGITPTAIFAGNGGMHGNIYIDDLSLDVTPTAVSSAVTTIQYALRMNTGGNFLYGTILPATGASVNAPRFDLVGENVGYCHADLDTDATQKQSRTAIRHYTNSEKPAAVYYALSNATDNKVRIGGGTSVLNAATQVEIYTAANNTTVTGTLRVIVNPSGNVTLGAVDGTGIGNLVMAALTATSANLASGSVVVDATTAKITIDGADGTVAAGVVGIAESGGSEVLSARNDVYILIDNDNNATTRVFQVYNNITAASGTPLFEVSEVGHTSALFFRDSISSPAQITSNQDNYDPGTAGWLRLSTDASRDITGFTGGAQGRNLRITNVGTQNIVLKEQVTSTAANQIITGTGADVTIGTLKSALLKYDSVSSRWRIVQTY